MKGNEAFAAAAIKGGCRYFFGYPITPQNELPEYMSRELPKAGGCFLQAESEIAAINMVYGAACAGARVMTSSSSPGIALKQEGISFLASAELPCVIINVSRAGPGIGGIQPGQADYYQSTRGGGNGDYQVIVYAPASIQEAVELTANAFETADYYRNPVMILGDGMIGQMMEPVELRAPKKRELPPKIWALTGTRGQRSHNTIKSLALEPDDLEEVNLKLKAKYDVIRKNEVQYEAFHLEDAEIVFVAYGTVSRIVKAVIEELSSLNIKAGLIRPITLWPFPFEVFDTLSSKTKCVMSIEMSLGQMVDDVKIAVKGRVPVEFYGRSGGNIPSPEAIVEKTKEILGGAE